MKLGVGFNKFVINSSQCQWSGLYSTYFNGMYTVTAYISTRYSNAMQCNASSFQENIIFTISIMVMRVACYWH